MKNLAIISSGDPEKDRENLEQAYKHDERLDQGLCPNGCTFLEWETPYNGHCPTCKFMLSTNVPYGKKETDSYEN